MNRRIIPMAVAFHVVTGTVLAQGTESELFEDTFQSGTLSSHWTIQEGRWTVENGSLRNRGGGLITLGLMPGTAFVMEAEIHFPPNWTSVILFYTAPQDYGTLYFGGGYWESFELEGQEVANYIQHRDPDIVPGRAHKIRVVCNDARVTLYYDDQVKGTAFFQPRPASRIAFRNQEKGGLLEIRTIRIGKLAVLDGRTVYALAPADFAGSRMYRDRRRQGKLSPTDRLRVNETTQEVDLDYAFSDGNVYEGCFARIPLNVAFCNRLRLDVDADDSKNTFFVILHDKTGEQHLVVKTYLEWKGWQELGIALESFLTSPGKKERSALHWKGDGNQVIDFPITAVDIGIAKRSRRKTDRGTVRLKKVRFVDDP